MAESDEPVSKRLRRRKDEAVPGTSKSSTKTPASTSSTSDSASAQENVSNSLLRLTDNCLQKLFERLDVDSLCQMANVCKRFRPITKRAFSERHKDFVFEGQSCKNAVFRRVLCKFGHLIKSIDASEAHFDTGERLDVNAIAKYCIKNLELLVVRNTIIDCDVVKPLFSRLKELFLIKCEFIGNKNDLFRNCPNLKSFGFEADYFGPDPLDMSRDRSIGFVVRRFPKLELLAFDCYRNFGCFHFADLLALNPQLKKIDIMAPTDDMYIEEIVNCTKNVEALAIHDGFDTPETQTRKRFLLLSKLKKLRKLRIEAGYVIYGRSVAPLMDAFAKNNVPIECLDFLEFIIGSKEIKSIRQLKTMKVLILDKVGNVTDADLAPLTKDLPLLENLQLYFGTKAKNPLSVDGLRKMVKNGKHLHYLAFVHIKNLKIDKKAFDGLLKAAQSRGNEKKLKIDIIGNKRTTGFNVPESVQKAGSKHLQISFEIEQSTGRR